MYRRCLPRAARSQSSGPGTARLWRFARTRMLYVGPARVSLVGAKCLHLVPCRSLMLTRVSPMPRLCLASRCALRDRERLQRRDSRERQAELSMRSNPASLLSINFTARLSPASCVRDYFCPVCAGLAGVAWHEARPEAMSKRVGTSLTESECAPCRCRREKKERREFPPSRVLRIPAILHSAEQ